MSSNHWAAAGAAAALLSVRQVAQLLGVSTAIVYRLCERGEMRHLRVGYAIRIHREDLAEYVERERTRP